MGTRSRRERGGAREGTEEEGGSIPKVHASENHKRKQQTQMKVDRRERGGEREPKRKGDQS